MMNALYQFFSLDLIHKRINVGELRKAEKNCGDNLVHGHDIGRPAFHVVML